MAGAAGNPAQLPARLGPTRSKCYTLQGATGATAALTPSQHRPRALQSHTCSMDTSATDSGIFVVHTRGEEDPSGSICVDGEEGDGVDVAALPPEDDDEEDEEDDDGAPEGKSLEELMDEARATALALPGYTICEPLGCGSYGTVWRAVHKGTGTPCAIKGVHLYASFGSDRQEGFTARDEIRTMAALRHENIIRLYEVVETSTKLFLALEIAAGGNLFDAVGGQGGAFPENVARELSRQLLRAIEYLHSQRVSHRDLKPENILLAAPGVMQIKIADFGLSRFVEDSDLMRTTCGTPLYMAPEVATRQYSPAVDLWSAGVIIYEMLSGMTPFSSALPTAQMNAAIRRAQYDFGHPHWQTVSAAAQDLIRRLLVVDPALRLTAPQALAHPWFAAVPAPQQPLRYAPPRRSDAGAAPVGGSSMLCDTP